MVDGPSAAGARPSEAVEADARPIDRALDAGIDVTHLDHHMGAALAPNSVDATVRIAMEYLCP